MDVHCGHNPRGDTNSPSNRVVVGTTDAASHTFTFNMENLTPNTTYYFRAFAGASRGEVVRFTTEAAAEIMLYVDGSQIDISLGIQLDENQTGILEIVVFPSDNIMTGQPIVTSSNPEVIVEGYQGVYLISGSESSLVTITVSTVYGDLTASVYVEFVRIFVRGLDRS